LRLIDQVRLQVPATRTGFNCQEFWGQIGDMIGSLFPMQGKCRMRCSSNESSFRKELYVQNQLNLSVSPTRREQLEGLVGVNPVEVRVLSAALFFTVFLSIVSFDSECLRVPVAPFWRPCWIGVDCFPRVNQPDNERVRRRCPMAWLHRVPTGHYYVCFRFGGRRFRRSLKTKNRRIAIRRRFVLRIPLLLSKRGE
jgi:hypothetical protein